MTLQASVPLTPGYTVLSGTAALDFSKFVILDAVIPASGAAPVRVRLFDRNLNLIATNETAFTNFAASTYAATVSLYGFSQDGRYINFEYVVYTPSVSTITSRLVVVDGTTLNLLAYNDFTPALLGSTNFFTLYPKHGGPQYYITVPTQ